jgi:hypothetical protein
MMFILPFFHKAVAISESDTASDGKLPLFEDSEKAKHVMGYVLPSPPSKSSATRRTLPFVIKLLLLIFAFAFTLFSGRSIINYTTLGYNAFLRSGKAHDHVVCSQEVTVDEPSSMGASPITELPVTARLLDRSGWAPPTCSSSKDIAHNCTLAIDAKGDVTYWQSADDPTGGVHWIVIDLKEKAKVHSLAMRTIPDFNQIGGSVRKHRVETATEKGNWDLVSLGTWRNDRDRRHISTQYCRL